MNNKNIDKKSEEENVELSERKLNPENPQERRQIIREAVRRTVEEYGEALKLLGSE